MHIDEFILQKAPKTVYYIPDFISEDEEQYLIGRVENAPKPKWEQLSHRRLQNWGGVLGKKGLIVDAELPDWLKLYVDKICRLPGAAFPESNRPNHVLVNEYLPGQGIMPHVDGPLYHPVIATISLGGHIMLDMYKRSEDSPVEPIEPTESMASMNMDNGNSSISDRKPVGSLLLERRSLVLIKDDLYTDYLHGIAERVQDPLTENVWNLDQCPGRQVGDTIDRSARISLTIRNIPKVIYLMNRKK